MLHYFKVCYVIRFSVKKKKSDLVEHTEPWRGGKAKSMKFKSLHGVFQSQFFSISCSSTWNFLAQNYFSFLHVWKISDIFIQIPNLFFPLMKYTLIAN